jgi:hypothetical protein
LCRFAAMAYGVILQTLLRHINWVAVFKSVVFVSVQKT